MELELIIPLVAVVSIFVILPGMVFHYITLWKKQKSLMPGDERMLEDLWRSAKRMERRIEALELLIEAENGEERSKHSTSRRFGDDDFSRN